MEQIIRKLRAIEQETERRKNLKINTYNREKQHKKQLEFHRNACRNRWVFGGNRSGKTECGAVETVWRARGIHPFRQNRPQTTGWVVSLSQQVQRDVAQKKILDYLDPSWIREIRMLNGKRDSAEYGVIDFIVIENVFGNLSKIGFKSCEAGREKFQGTSLDYVWFDEEPPKDIYEECLMRVLDTEGDVYATMTPLKGLSWVYEDIYLNPKNDENIWCTFMQWEDNPYLATEEIRRMSATLDESSLESRKYGKFSASFGLVYGEFDPSVHVIDPVPLPKEWFDTLSIDPGLNNPLSCHFYACDYDGNVYVVAEHYEAGRDVTYHAAKIKAIAESLGWPRDRFGRLSAWIDSAANQKTLAAEKSVTELFCEQGIQVNPHVNKDLFSGINRVKSYLKVNDGKPKLYVFRNCVNLIRELKNYRWAEGEKPVKADDHCLDELRYYLCTKPEPYRPKEEKSAIQLDKERLYKKLKRRK